MQEQSISRDRAEMNQHLLDEKPQWCWYPSIFFFDLEKGQTVWEIFGSEQFIRIY